MALSRSLAVVLFAFALSAVALAHFEPDGAVPQPGSTTATGDPNTNQGETGPEPGSPAAAAAGQNQPQPTTTPAPGSGSGAGAGAGGMGASASEAPATTDASGAAGAGASSTEGPSATSDAASSGATTSSGPESSEDADAGAADSSSSPEDDPLASDDALASASASDEEDDDGSVCFPADATVVTLDGSVKMMRDLAVGDKVLVSSGVFADVFMFTHKLDNVVYNFVRAQTASGASIRLTSGHYIYVNGGNLVAASALRVGDSLETDAGVADKIVHVSTVKATGLYNPQTVHGDIIVDGFRASTYTKAVHPVLAHSLLAPFRSVYNHFGLFTSMLDSGSDSLATIAPSGVIAH